MKKRLKMKNLLKVGIPIIIAVIFASILLIGYQIMKKAPEKTFLEMIETGNYGTITNYAIYGIHMNVEGNFTLPENNTNPKLYLANKTTEIEIPWEVTQKENVYTFKTSEYINEGINLEKLPREDLFLIIKTEYQEPEKEEVISKYYSFTNASKYNDMEYYTLTNNHENNKIKMSWNEEDLCPTWKFSIQKTTLPKDVYDITIDPGHDGTDPGKVVCVTASSIYDPTYYGTCENGGTKVEERELNLNVSLALKEKLEELGYKVTLTREDNDKRVDIYEPMGSATMANDTKSKFNFAIHHNSSGISGGVSYLKGLELYVANDTNFDFAKIIIQELNEIANVTTSSKTQYLKEDGIYQRFFTQAEIDDDEYGQYKNTNMIWYYYIREVGGVSTHAIYNGYNPEEYPHKNDHYDSNNTAEPYLFELGYMDNLEELQNIQNHKSNYAEALTTALQKYLEQE